MVGLLTLDFLLFVEIPLPTPISFELVDTIDMAKKLTVIEQQQMLAARLAKFGSGSKCLVIQTGVDDSPRPKKKAIGIVIREPQHVARVPRTANQRRARCTEWETPRLVGGTLPAAPLAILPPVIQEVPPATPEVPSAMPAKSSAARSASPRVEETGENTRDPNDCSYLGWDPRWAAA